MLKKTLFRWAAFGLLFAAGTAGVFAQVTVSGGFALSSIEDIKIRGYGSAEIDPGIGLGGNIYADYLLPVNVPMSLGFEIGFDTATFGSFTSFKDTVSTIPLLVRAAYHFDLLPRLDLYVVGKLGYALGFWEGDAKTADENNGTTFEDKGGIAFGFDVGAAYYLSPTFGFFVEVGFDRYALESTGSDGNDSLTLEAPFNRYVTAGVSLKFDTASTKTEAE